MLTLVVDVLKQADLRMLRNLKGVSPSWRARARRVLCAQLCRRNGQPVPTSPANVTDIDVEPCLKAVGPGVMHVTEAMARLPNLACMHAHGFVGDVAAVRGLGPALVFTLGVQPQAGSQRHLAARPVRSCISGRGEPPPGGLQLTVRAARYGPTVRCMCPRGPSS